MVTIQGEMDVGARVGVIVVVVGEGRGMEPRERHLEGTKGRGNGTMTDVRELTGTIRTLMMVM